MSSVLAYTSASNQARSSSAARKGWAALDRQVHRTLDRVGGTAHLRDIAALLPGIPAHHLRESLHGFVRSGTADFGPDGWTLRKATVVDLHTTVDTLKAAA